MASLQALALSHLIFTSKPSRALMPIASHCADTRPGMCPLPTLSILACPTLSM